MHYLFDGSYTGFLCCVFESFERKEFDVTPVTDVSFQNAFFTESRQIPADAGRAARVHAGLQNKCGKAAASDFYRVFLSEDPQAWYAAFHIIRKIFREGPTILNNYGDADLLFFSQTLKKVGRERHRMQAFVRFKKSSDGLYVSVVAPDFNVLPLLAGFFRNRYADQSWLIYDAKRKYGLLYDKRHITEVTLTEAEKNGLSITTAAVTLDEQEAAYERLWKSYYQSTNIVSRRNMKLHLQHVPKRYWKYLPEKFG